MALLHRLFFKKFKKSGVPSTYLMMVFLFKKLSTLGNFNLGKTHLLPKKLQKSTYFLKSIGAKRSLPIEEKILKTLKSRLLSQNSTNLTILNPLCNNP